MHTTPEELNRARVYLGLALGFDRPDALLAEAIEDGSFLEAMETAAAELDDDDLARAVSGLAACWPVDVDALHRTYTATFAIESDAGVSLYEVEYAPGTLVTNTNRLADIAGFYEAFELDVSESLRDRVDALSTQLEFVGFLAVRDAQLAEVDPEAASIVRDARAMFLEDHLGRWTPRVVEEIETGVDEPFYRALAAVLSAIVANDGAALGIDPDVYEEHPSAPLEQLTGLDRDEEGRLAFTCGATPQMATHQPRSDNEH